MCFWTKIFYKRLSRIQTEIVELFLEISFVSVLYTSHKHCKKNVILENNKINYT